KLDGIVAVHGREHVDELVNREAVVQIIQQRLRGNARATKDDRSTHYFWVGMNRAVIKRQHDRRYVELENASIAALRRVVGWQMAAGEPVMHFSGRTPGKKRVSFRAERSPALCCKVLGVAESRNPANNPTRSLRDSSTP